MKNIMRITMVAAFALFAGYNFFQSNTETRETSELVLVDVEALAAGEKGCVNSTQNWGYCFVEGTRYKCENYWIWNCVRAVN